MLAEHVRPGVTTGELDQLAEQFIREHGDGRRYKGYRGFPAFDLSLGERRSGARDSGRYALRDGDIVGIDVGVEKRFLRRLGRDVRGRGTSDEAKRV